MTPEKEEEWRDKKDKALNEFIESGALATNICPNYLRDAYFKAGFKAAVKMAQKEIDQLNIDLDNPYCPVCGGCGEDGCCATERCLYPGIKAETLKDLKESYEILCEEYESLKRKSEAP